MKMNDDIPEMVSMESKVCPLGCSSNDEIVLFGYDLLHNLPGKFTVVKCNNCGLMRTNPRPTQETIGFYYPEDYGPYHGTKIKHVKNNNDTAINKLKKIIENIVNFNIRQLPELPPGKMLEIGCASGSFLHEMAEKGWQVEGIEFSSTASDSARALGYLVHSGSLETAPEPSQKFDLVVGWMVFEHLHEPIDGLKKLRDWSSDDAHLVFTVPNAASLEFKIFKKYWYALQLPTHLFHFTPDTISAVLSASGWRLQKIYHQRVITNLVVSLGYVLREKGFTSIANKFIQFPKSSGKWQYVLFPVAWIFSLFGQTGRMTIHARREP